MTWLDHAATRLPRRAEAMEAARDAMTLASPGRGAHEAATRADAVLEDARAAVRALCPTGTPCFLAGATAALNQAILGWRPRPRRVAVGPLVHNAVRRPLIALGVPTWTLPHGPEGRIDLARAGPAWPADVDLVVVGHGSNVNGVLQPVAELAELAARRGAAVVVDAAQTAGAIVPLELGGCAAVAFGAHKAVGALPGVGALVVADGVTLEPLVHGGVGFDSGDARVPDALPTRLESGTPNLPGIAAFGAAARACRAWDLARVTGELHEAIRAAGLTPMGGALPVASLAVPDPRFAEELLDRVYGVATRAGLHCAPAAHEALGTRATGTLRISASEHTTRDDLDHLTEALRGLRRAQEELVHVL